MCEVCDKVIIGDLEWTGEFFYLLRDKDQNFWMLKISKFALVRVIPLRFSSQHNTPLLIIY